MSQESHSEEVVYSGKVQGVGFRYTTYETAREFAVTGEVENLPDGRVRLLAQGEPAEVAAFRQALESRMSAFVREVEVVASGPKPAVDGFRIVR
ncbi:MAG: acylphosphatase [Opitutales bacterium]